MLSSPGLVLVVDDEPMVRRILRRALEHHGFRVWDAESALEALAALGSGAAPVALVLSDVQMPGMTGIELARRVRRSWPALPFILMSGHWPSELGDAGSGLREVSFLRKPFSPEQLLATMRAALGSAARS